MVHVEGGPHGVCVIMLRIRQRSAYFRHSSAGKLSLLIGNSSHKQELSLQLESFRLDDESFCQHLMVSNTLLTKYFPRNLHEIGMQILWIGFICSENWRGT